MKLTMLWIVCICGWGTRALCWSCVPPLLPSFKRKTSKSFMKEQIKKGWGTIPILLVSLAVIAWVLISAGVRRPHPKQTSFMPPYLPNYLNWQESDKPKYLSYSIELSLPIDTVGKKTCMHSVRIGLLHLFMFLFAEDTDQVLPNFSAF